MSYPCLQLHLDGNVSCRTYTNKGVCLAPSTHSITLGMTDADTGPYFDLYLKGWCQGYFHLHHEGVLTKDEFSRLLHTLYVPTKFRMETSFVDLLKPMCDTLDAIVNVMEISTGLKWWYSAEGIHEKSLVRQLEYMDQYVARNVELKVDEL